MVQLNTSPCRPTPTDSDIDGISNHSSGLKQSSRLAQYRLPLMHGFPCCLSSKTYAWFPPFRCRSSVAVSPFCRCKIPSFCINYVRKFRSVTAVNSKKIRNGSGSGNGVRKRQRLTGTSRCRWCCWLTKSRAKLKFWQTCKSFERFCNSFSKVLAVAQETLQDLETVGLLIWSQRLTRSPAVARMADRTAL